MRSYKYFCDRPTAWFLKIHETRDLGGESIYMHIDAFPSQIAYRCFSLQNLLSHISIFKNLAVGLCTQEHATAKQHAQL